MNAAELSQRLAEHAASIASFLLPGGKKFSGEWKVGGVEGEEGQSLSVRLTGAKAGVWKDFATGDGGDLIDLWAAVRHVSIGEAMAEIKLHLGIKDETTRPPQKIYQSPSKAGMSKPSTAVVDWLTSRGLTEETIAAFKIAQIVAGPETYAVFPYLRDGVLVNAKSRNIANKRDMRQSPGAEPCLFGWHLINPKARTVAICEGEIDAMTLYQVGIPALSVNAGAGNHQWLESDWDRLQAFSTIYICYDDDEPGRKGASEISRRLGIERCRLVKFGAKDANEWLMAGAAQDQFMQAIARSAPQDPDELRSISDFMGSVKSLFYPTAGDHSSGSELRLGAVACDWFRFRPMEVSVWTGYNGHGKSLLLNQALLGVIEQGERCCVFSGEMMPAYQGKRLVKQAAGLDRPTPEYIDAIGGWVQDKMWIFNVAGSATMARLVEVFTYAAKRYGITQFVVDSLMMTDVPEDGPGAHSKQKDAMQMLANFAKQNRVHVHLVAHPRKAKDETGAPGKLDVAGSSKITDGADNVFAVWSARKEEGDPPDDKPDAYLSLEKQRNGDVQHKKQWLWFDRASQQYCGNQRRRPYRYLNWSKQETDDDVLSV